MARWSGSGQDSVKNPNATERCSKCLKHKKMSEIKEMVTKSINVGRRNMNCGYAICKECSKCQIKTM